MQHISAFANISSSRLGNASLIKNTACQTYDDSKEQCRILCSLPKDTILFHGTDDIGIFNNLGIKLGNLKLLMFASDKNTAVNHINNTGIICQKYIHILKIKKDIVNLELVDSLNTISKWTKKYVENFYCNPQNSKYKTYGICYINEINEFELALSNPTEYLEYVATQQII